MDMGVTDMRSTDMGSAHMGAMDSMDMSIWAWTHVGLHHWRYVVVRHARRHLLAALLCGLWLAHGERAAFRVLRAAAGRLAAPLRLLLALPATPDRPRIRVRRLRSDRRRVFSFSSTRSSPGSAVGRLSSDGNRNPEAAHARLGSRPYARASAVGPSPHHRTARALACLGPDH